MCGLVCARTATYTGKHRQERITTTKKGSITSVQAVYVPADDLTDPAPATTFAHLDATTVLSRGIAELGIYPAVDPLDSKSRMLDPRIVGQEHYEVATATQKILQDYKSLQDIIAILGMDELSEEDKLTVERARKIQVRKKDVPDLASEINLRTSSAFHVPAFPSCPGLHGYRGQARLAQRHRPLLQGDSFGHA